MIDKKYDKVEKLWGSIADVEVNKLFDHRSNRCEETCFVCSNRKNFFTLLQNNFYYYEWIVG
ncbi:MAG: hypothetical protein ABI855_16725 [Bacteroidota bacterium]